MKRFNDLDRLLDHIWTYVQEGAEQGFKHPFGTPTFVTAGPEARTITLLSADADARTLAFTSDARAAKVEALRRDAEAAFHRWDPERREQLVLCGTATVHTDDDVADAHWQQAPPQALALYLKPEAPGTPVDAPRSGLGGAPAENGEWTRDAVAAGRPHFAVVETAIDRIDWLHTHPEGHYRARFRWDGEAFRGQWVLP